MSDRETLVDMKERPSKKVSGGKEASGVCERLCSHYHIKAKGLGKRDRETMESDLKRWSRRWASVASETLLPTEPPMGPRRSGLHVRGLNILLSVLSRSKGEQNGLCAQQLEPSSPDLTSLPVSPKNQAGGCWLIGRRRVGG